MRKGKVNGVVFIVIAVIAAIIVLGSLFPDSLEAVCAILGGGGALAAVAANNREKRKEEREATEADRQELAEVQANIEESTANLKGWIKDQQQLFISHGENKEKLEEEYKQKMQEAIDDSKNKSMADKLDFLKSRGK